MAKNEGKYSSSKNNSNKNSSNTHKNIFIICAAIVIVLLVALWIFSIKEQKLPTTPTQGKEGILPAQGTQATEGQVLQPPTEEEEDVGLAGKAFGVLNSEEWAAATFSAGTSAINPKTGVVVIDSATSQGETFGVDVVAKGSLSGVASDDNCQYKSNQFTVKVKYPILAFEYVSGSAKIMLAGTWTKVETITQDQTFKYIEVKFTGNSPFEDTFCYLQYNKLAEFSFKPLNTYFINQPGGMGTPPTTKEAPIFVDFVSILNTVGTGGSSANLITNYDSDILHTFTFKKRYYLDQDGDEYSEGSKAQDKSKLFGFGEYEANPSNYVSLTGDCDDTNNAVNPLAVENCDGIDNNCDGSKDEGVIPAVEAVCNDKQCGVYYDCANTRAYDCNNKVDITGTYDPAQISFNSNDEKCNSLGEGNICVDGTCTPPTQVQDCSQAEPYLTCSNDLSVCNTELTTTKTDLTTCTTNLATCNNELTTCGNNLDICMVSQGGCILKDTDFVDPAAFSSLTPACGDGTCQTFEHKLTCPQDCIVDCGPNPTFCQGIDTDNDSLTDDYENYLSDLSSGNVILFELSNSDTDGDGIKDNKDYCPGTDTKGSKLTVASGHINVNGCYAGDIGQQKADKQRPDGCFSVKDTAFLISYYTSITKDQSCINLYNMDIK